MNSILNLAAIFTQTFLNWCLYHLILITIMDLKLHKGSFYDLHMAVGGLALPQINF